MSIFQASNVTDFVDMRNPYDTQPPPTRNPPLWAGFVGDGGALFDDQLWVVVPLAVRASGGRFQPCLGVRVNPGAPWRGALIFGTS